MITILRKNQRVLMLIIAVLTIIAFIWLYNPANYARAWIECRGHDLRPKSLAGGYRT